MYNLKLFKCIHLTIKSSPPKTCQVRGGVDEKVVATEWQQGKRTSRTKDKVLKWMYLSFGVFYRIHSGYISVLIFHVPVASNDKCIQSGPCSNPTKISLWPAINTWEPWSYVHGRHYIWLKQPYALLWHICTSLGVWDLPQSITSVPSTLLHSLRVCVPTHAIWYLPVQQPNWFHLSCWPRALYPSSSTGLNTSQHSRAGVWGSEDGVKGHSWAVKGCARFITQDQIRTSLRNSTIIFWNHVNHTYWVATDYGLWFYQVVRGARLILHPSLWQENL